MPDIDKINKSLNSNYILVEASFSAWSARKTAKEVAREAEVSHGAVEGAVSAGVKLLAGADTAHKEVTSAQGKIRSYVYEKTLPFGKSDGPTKKGPRLLPVANAMPFMAEVKKLTTLYEGALANFLAAYPNLRLIALQNCSTLAQAEDYPEPEDMPGRFSADVSYLPVPEIGSFKNMQLPSDVIDGLAQDMAETQQSALKCGFDDLRKRIAGELNRTVTQLTKLKEGERTSIFKSMQTSVENLSGLLEASIPVLGDDPKLKELHGKLVELGKINPESYKKTEHARIQGETLAQEATEILNKINEEAEPVVLPVTSAQPTPEAPPAPKAPMAPPPIPKAPIRAQTDLDDVLDELDAAL
jgi:hypothetical protein